MAKRPKDRIHGKRVKGFPIVLPMTHWLLIRQLYTWLDTQGTIPDDAVEAFALIPPVEVSGEHWESALATGACGLTEWVPPTNGGSWVKPPMHRSKTVRVRSIHVKGMIALLKLCAAFHVGGQIGRTFMSRVEKLEEISLLDHLVDASR